MSAAPNDPNPYAAESGESGEPVRTSGKALVSLILGVMSIGLCCSLFTGIPAIILGVLGLGDVEKSRGRLTGRGLAIAGIVTGAIGSTVMVGMSIALLLPAVQAARSAAHRNHSMNNLQQVGLGLMQFDQAHGKYPAAATRDDAGNPLVSWRVAILPYLDRNPLYEKFTKDEPWNGPNNKALVSDEPDNYRALGATDQPPGETNVLAIVGPDTVLTPDGGTSLRDIRDGTSKTIVFVELAGSGIAWSEPRDITIDEFIAAMQRQPGGAGLRPVYPFGVLCGFADGSVQFIPTGTPPDVLRGLCTRAGGEAVTMPMD